MPCVCNPHPGIFLLYFCSSSHFSPSLASVICFLNPLLKAEKLTHLLGASIFLFSGFGDKPLSSNDHLKFGMSADGPVVFDFLLFDTFCSGKAVCLLLLVSFAVNAGETERKRRKRERISIRDIFVFLDQDFYFHESPGEGVGEKSQCRGLNANPVGRGKLLRVLRNQKHASNLNVS